MKAKEWYRRMAQANNSSEFENTLAECLTSLIEEAEVLIEKRKCTTNNQIRAAIEESNQKWQAIIRIHTMNSINENNFGKYINSVILDEDGFKAGYVYYHPEHSWYFDLQKHEKKMENKQKELDQDELFIYKVTPYEKLTMENLSKECLNCIAALGSYISHGFPKEWLTPLAGRITLLLYWNSKGKIDLDDIKRMEEDPAKFAATHRSEITDF